MELKGRLGVFLQELYRRVECEVRVGEYLSEPFEVTSGLRQGCMPLLFSLYISGAVEKSKNTYIHICMQQISNVFPRLRGTCNHCIVLGNAKHNCGELTGHGFVQASGLKV